MSLAIAVLSAGCSWILGVSGDPEVVETPEEAGLEAGTEAAVDAAEEPDSASIPPDDAANADEDAATGD